MTWTDRTGLTSKQLTAVILSIITLIGGLGLSVTNPNAVEYWFKSQTAITEAIIHEQIEAYIDQGLGGSPYQTEKPCSYICNSIDIDGTIYYYALSGITGKLEFSGTDADVLINSALGASTGIVHLKSAIYSTDSTLNVGVGDILEGEGTESIINYDAGGSCVTITGDDSTVRSLKIVIVAGAGAGGTRPNGIYASGRNNVHISDYSFYGDRTVGYDNSESRQMGVVFVGTIKSSISNSLIENCGASSISLFNNSNQNTIINCIATQSGVDGMLIYGGSDNIVQLCQVYNNGHVNGTWNGIRIRGLSHDNIITNNEINYNDYYGVYIADAMAERNIVKDNQLIGNAQRPVRDDGTDTKLATKVFQFIQGTTFISANAMGWEINAEADMAIALGQLPLKVQQVVRIKIWAVALGAPAGVGGQMHLDISFKAGGSLEAWNLATNSWTLANFDGKEADYVNTNVIHWVVEDDDVGYEISNLLGEDSLEMKVNGGTAVAPDGATNAIFRVIEIEYV